jgi:adenosylcobinamide kinase / adenosylcobinamide-phosphate guanylyltransferase
METVLLGTGAADGWPNAFCRCDSCTSALRRRDIRGQTAALVDDRLLIDCGPEVPAAAARLGRTLSGVRTILITHDHPDHFGPQALLFRSWIAEAGPIDLVGPADILDRAGDWIGPDDPVTLRPVAAGDRISLSGYNIRVLEAKHHVYHHGDSVLYDVTSPDGSRLLWATDTGPLTVEWFTQIAGARYDAVFLDTTFGDTRHSPGHHTLDDALTTISALRACGAVHDTTEVVGVHLSHHHRSIDHVAGALAAVGARPGADGDVVVSPPAHTARVINPLLGTEARIGRSGRPR